MRGGNSLLYHPVIFLEGGMKISAIAALLTIFAALNAGAESVSEKDEACLLHRQHAVLVMDFRQAGKSLPEMLEMAGDDRLSRYITMRAYDWPVCSDSECKMKSRRDIGDQIYLECLRSSSE